MLRAAHLAPPLVPSTKLMWIANTWSTYMAQSSRFEHSFAPYGENIAYIGPTTNFTQAALVAINMFYNEGPTGGHYVNLVWKSYKYVGIGVANNTKRTYVTFEFAASTPSRRRLPEVSEV
jgi:uncharacterized protein YkwD